MSLQCRHTNIPPKRSAPTRAFPRSARSTASLSPPSSYAASRRPRHPRRTQDRTAYRSTRGHVYWVAQRPGFSGKAAGRSPLQADVGRRLIDVHHRRPPYQKTFISLRQFGHSALCTNLAQGSNARPGFVTFEDSGGDSRSGKGSWIFSSHQGHTTDRAS